VFDDLAAVHAEHLDHRLAPVGGVGLVVVPDRHQVVTATTSAITAASHDVLPHWPPPPRE
jgi:hypothetical protein